MLSNAVAFEFRRKQSRLNAIGWILFFLGLVLILVDMTTPFPTPVQGQFALLWGIISASGIGVWVYGSKQLPTKEALQIADSDEFLGGLTAAQLSQVLNIAPDRAYLTLVMLVRIDIARIERFKDQEFFVFPEIRAHNPKAHGSWMCKTCWTFNGLQAQNCRVCKSPKEAVAVTKEEKD